MAEKDTQRKVLAVLAGGLVLGVGIGVTLAAWNDSEFATGTFTAGSFNLEGSTTSAGAGYDDHNVDLGQTAAALVFELPAVASSMSPGDVVYAPFWVRLDSTTTNSATLVPSGITAGTGGMRRTSHTRSRRSTRVTCAMPPLQERSSRPERHSVLRPEPPRFRWPRARRQGQQGRPCSCASR